MNNTTSLRSPSQFYDNTGKKFKPSIEPTPNFNAKQDAEALLRAMRCWGTDEAQIIAILGRRTSAERQMIVEAYKNECKRELTRDLTDELSGHFRDLAILLTETPVYLMAKSLYYAMVGVGTNEMTIIEIVVGCSNDELKRVKEAYIHVLRDKGIKDPKRTLESDIRAETRGYFCKALLQILQANGTDPTADELQNLNRSGASRMVNQSQATTDAKTLQDATTKAAGAADKIFMDVIVNKSIWQLAAISTEFEKTARKPLIKAIDESIKGDLATLLIALVEHAVDRPKFYSELLFHAMVGAGTRDFLLMRVMVLRSEIDLQTIQGTFNQTHESLEKWIKGDTEGDYEKLLLTILGTPTNN